MFDVVYAYGTEPDNYVFGQTVKHRDQAIALADSIASRWWMAGAKVYDFDTNEVIYKTAPKHDAKAEG